MMNSLSAMTGLPASKPHAKKKHASRRAKPGRPDGVHLANAAKAHGQKDYDAAANHAIAYVNAAKKHVKTLAPPPSEPLSPEMPSAPTQPSSARNGASKLAAALLKTRKTV